MKSLEIVKNVLKVYEMDDSTFGLLYVEDITTIKQDLEVLEIFKNKEVDITFIRIQLKWMKIEDVLEDYNENAVSSRKLTLEELLKLKQWLEVNE